MTTLLILFFLSLIGISFMIGQKLVLIRTGNIVHKESIHKLIPDFQTIKITLEKTTKKGGYLATVTVIRLYVQSSNLLKNVYETTKTRIMNFKKVEDGIENKGASKFLKMISEYKHKVKNIKRQIEKENVE